MTDEELIERARARAQTIEKEDFISAEILDALASILKPKLWQPIASAPLGTYVTKRVSRTDDKVMTRRHYEPQWILVWQAGDRVRFTHWLPDVNRWNGFTREFPPTHWRECEPPNIDISPGEINEPQETASGLGTPGTS